MLSTASFEKKIQVWGAKAKILIISDKPNIRTKYLTNKPHYSIPLSHSFGVLHTDGPALQAHRRQNSHGSQREVQCTRTVPEQYKNHFSHHWNAATSSIGSARFYTAHNLGQRRHFHSIAEITVQIRHYYTKQEHYALYISADVKYRGSSNPSTMGIQAPPVTLCCQPSQLYCQQIELQVSRYLAGWGWDWDGG